MQTHKSSRRHTYCGHTQRLSHTLHLGGMWRILWHTVYLTSKSWGRDESIWVCKDISIWVSHTPHHCLCFMLHYRPLYLKYFLLQSPERQLLSSLLCTCPLLSLLHYFNNCQPNFFQDCTIVYLFLFICMLYSQTVEGKMLGRRGEKKKKMRIIFWLAWDDMSHCLFEYY